MRSKGVSYLLLKRPQTLSVPSTFDGRGYAPNGGGSEPSLDQAHERSTYPVQRMDRSGEGEHIVEHRIVDPAPLYSELFLVSFYVPGQRAKGEFAKVFEDRDHPATHNPSWEQPVSNC